MRYFVNKQSHLKNLDNMELNCMYQTADQCSKERSDHCIRKLTGGWMGVEIIHLYKTRKKTLNTGRGFRRQHSTCYQ